MKSYENATPKENEEMSRIIQGAIADDKDLNKFIQEKPERLNRTNEIVDKILPTLL
jgi:hypothetical protein